ncbi:Mur ligase family protein [Roseovarius arcticus]|uniref:Mur ligase family protein n=1 Tax=Roseovarius arcticus TaxID=2547404 RepID=UPI001110491F|nr:Mur ligase family protein [Roseovarius arcticus]
MNAIDRLEATLEQRTARPAGLRIDPARRLTGPGLLWDRPGAVLDVYLVGPDGQMVATLWQRHARRVLDALGWQSEHLICRPFSGGVNLAISAPPDQLHSAVLAVQTAWHYCAAELQDEAPLPFDELIDDLRSIIADESNPPLIALLAAAASHDVDILWDDDEVSLGHGATSQTWRAGDLPSPQDVDWAALRDVPVALITGTNGKTTTTRLCAAIIRAAGKVAGLSSTDTVQVGSDVLDRGDFSGPGGARMVLRDPRVEIAVLEVARGGILRRGLATRRARVAVVTNVAKDHLGEFGVMTLAELVEVKFTVARGLAADGVLVLNADDPNVVAGSSDAPRPIWWFSLDDNSEHIIQARTQGQPCAYLRDGALSFFDGNTEMWSIAVEDVPILLGGAATHNIQNTLAAICACAALNVPFEAITAGLAAFGTGPGDNPGRLNEFEVNGARIFVDYAHNPHSIAAMCSALSQIPAKRRFMMLSQPGDRSDKDIDEATMTALQFKPNVIVVAEIVDYLRGRELNETLNLIETSAIAGGVKAAQVLRANSPSNGTELILEQVQKGDLVLLLVLSDRERVFEMLAS